MAMALRVVVPPHPLLNHWLTVLRDRQTPQPLYGSALAELGRWLSYEALRDWLPHQDLQVDTDGGVTHGQVIDASVPLLAAVSLPAGLGLWQGGQAVLPAAQLGMVGSETGTSGPMVLPAAIDARAGVLIYWGELAQPEPLLALLDHLAGLGVSGQRLRLITAIAAAPALQAVGERHGSLTIYTAAIDPDLTEAGRVVPGVGNMQQRLLGFASAH
ncbi:MAG: uracil phosphoribosyltransferase [Synechococcaceae bacterium WB9_2_112]|nr:uracil phosphoribosyltransferase [Synechococcaceae bacterium WB9_2_112]